MDFEVSTCQTTAKIWLLNLRSPPIRNLGFKQLFGPIRRDAGNQTIQSQREANLGSQRQAWENTVQAGKSHFSFCLYLNAFSFTLDLRCH